MSKIQSNNLLEADIEVIRPPRKSNRFESLSLYYKGIYYFPKDIKGSTKRKGKPFEIQAIYYQGKWYQDTFYITEDFKDFLLRHVKL